MLFSQENLQYFFVKKMLSWYHGSHCTTVMHHSIALFLFYFINFFYCIQFLVECCLILTFEVNKEFNIRTNRSFLLKVLFYLTDIPFWEKNFPVSLTKVSFFNRFITVFANFKLLKTFAVHYIETSSFNEKIIFTNVRL